MMTKKSWVLIGACALASAVALRRRMLDTGAQTKFEMGRCEFLLRGLDVRCALLR